jgi:hypothetical protein
MPSRGASGRRRRLDDDVAVRLSVDVFDRGASASSAGNRASASVGNGCCRFNGKRST